MIRVEISSTRKCGLEVWQVRVNGTFAAEFMSEWAAEQRKAKIIKSLKGYTNVE
jgi:hypothetical protein